MDRFPVNFRLLFLPENLEILCDKTIGFLGQAEDNQADNRLISCLKTIEGYWLSHYGFSAEEQWIEFLECLFSHNLKSNSAHVIETYLEKHFELLAQSIKLKLIPSRVEYLSGKHWQTILRVGWGIDFDQNELEKMLTKCRLIYFFAKDYGEFEKYDRAWFRNRILDALIDADFPNDKIDLFEEHNNLSFLAAGEDLSVTLSPRDIFQIMEMEVIYEQWLEAKDMIRSSNGRPWEDAAEIMLLKTPGETKEKDWSTLDAIRYCVLTGKDGSPKESIEKIAKAKNKSPSATCKAISKRFESLPSLMTDRIKKPTLFN